MAERDDQLDAEEAAFTEAVAQALTETADEFADAVQDATELVAARFSVGRIARMWGNRTRGLVRRLLGTAETAATAAAEDVDAELPDGWDNLPARYDDDTLPEGLGQYVTTTEHLLRAVGDRLAEVARSELAAGVDAGEDIDQLKARLRAAFSRAGAQFGPAREQRIGQTEASRAWNTSTLAAAQAATGPDRPVVKQWVTRHDAKVRSAHDAVDGQIQLLAEPFTVGGVEMQTPGDPSAPPALVVNCRCRLAVAPELSAAAFEAKVPARPGVLESEESRMEAALTLPVPRSRGSAQFHGTRGRPSYMKYHPSGRNKQGLERHDNGGWLGSAAYTEEQHQQALKGYTVADYGDMNDWLRHRTAPTRLTQDETEDRISALTNLIAIQDPTTSEATLWRGSRHFIDVGPGDEFHDKGFTSTSSDEEIGRRMGRKGGSVFRIHAPKGSQMLDVVSVGARDYEKEMILPPATKLRVLKVERPEDPTGPAVVYDLEIING
ncbi:ADP-ribosyltransferase [Streptomyces sp. NPDC058548]|uniref:ADP-ribosyltransferase n=1 Tax=Streptomyces sp. NPDC058548 TaxID=3346545 RepID=UPI00364ED005